MASIKTLLRSINHRDNVLQVIESVHRTDLSAIGHARETDMVAEILKRDTASLNAIEKLSRGFLKDQSSIGLLAGERISEILGGVSTVSEEMRKIGGLNRLLESYFRLPNNADMQHLGAIAHKISTMNSLAKFALPQAEIGRLVEALKSPWVNVHDAPGSLAGFAGLAALGNGLTTVPPFDALLTNALRSGLGDWREIGQIPENIVTDSTARTNFYEDVGFDFRLTDFPHEAFVESLDVTGIRVPLPPEIVPADARVKSVPEDVPIENIEAYLLLHHFENRVRRFIVDKMEQEFGPAWMKHRIPGDMREAWESRKEREVAEGDADPEAPPIYFADFTDYEKIIVRRDNWKAVFRAVFYHKESVQESFRRLFPVRAVTMHNREITANDLLLMHPEIRRLLKAIDGSNQ